MIDSTDLHEEETNKTEDFGNYSFFCGYRSPRYTVVETETHKEYRMENGRVYYSLKSEV